MKILEILKKVAIEFCTETSLHGVQYIVEPRRALIERCFWRLAIFVAFIASMLSFHTIYVNKYSQSQVLTSLVSTSYPIYALEQPAITICSADKAFQSSVDRFFSMMSFNDEEEIKLLKQSLPIFLHHAYSGFLKDDTNHINLLTRWTDYLEKINWSLIEFLLYISQPCSEMILQCTVGSVNYNCSDIFKLTRTGFGFCCSFEYIQKKDNFLMQQYPVEPRKYKIKLSKQYGFEDGLAVLLNLSSQGSVYSAFYKDTASIFIHSSKEFPADRSIKVYISGGTETFLRFKSTGMMGSSGLEDVDPLIRQCYMEDEIKLKYFDHYTLGNCVLESDMEVFITKCNCLSIQHPNLGIFEDCSVFHEHCISYQISKLFTDHTKYITIDGERIPCLERCTYVRYTPSVSFGDFDVPEYNSFRLWDEVNVTGLTLVQIFQQSAHARVFKRSVTRHHWEILVVVGGLAGVVFGLNLLSIIELIYYFIFRFYFYIKKEINSLSTNKKSEINRNTELKPITIFVTSHHDDINK
ncbi:hypothetical protein LSTR_LSTR002271 [Laodelphax striatellus]|uniref:Sodium channel protein Nach n=1 Tax=Laodelphax striatellus TaxID=195883 RepID=A0A482XGQ5_LAOST|nr:hypothetical protein LSTR_LSTR002271 [Laodelphax striatellus]